MSTPACRVLLALSLTFAAAAHADFHVSPGGADSNAGTTSRPFATLERAREAVRTLKAKGPLPKGPLTLWIHGGDHRRTNALELTAADSGTPDSPIRWESAPDENARLLGGLVVPASAWKPVSDESVLERLDPAARPHVRQVDLRSMGIRDFGEMKSRGFSRSTVPSHCELFHGGRPMTLARWPNDGQFTKIAGFPATSGKGDDHGGNIGDIAGGFTYEGDRPARWRDRGDVWVHGYWAWDWANSYEKAESIDLTQHLIRTAPPYGLYGFRKGQRFQFLNVLEELDQPGEWFLDRKSGLAWFWPPAPPAGTATGKPETLVSLLDQPLIRLADASHVTIRGLVLEATRSSAVEIRGGTGNRVAACRIRNIGNHGVVIEGGSNHGVSGCDITDTGDGGVNLTGGDRQTLTPGGHFVENSHFERQGRWSKCYVPAIHLQGVGLRASHNLIHDHPHCAILYWGNDHLMDFNEIHHIALETGDVGAIYTGRDYSFRGNRIRHNYIHETGGVGMGSMGVYMDDCVSGTEVFGNVFYKVHWAMFIGGGRDHRVENNYFIDCDPAVRADARGMDTSPVWRSMVDDFMRKQLAAVPAELYRQRYPEIRSLDPLYAATNDFKGIPAENNVITRNICVGKWLELGWHARTNEFTTSDNFTSGDPGFVNAARQDFTLRPDSPALRLGIQPVSFQQIGLRVDADRQRLAQLR
jgi:hypothetical protein